MVRFGGSFVRLSVLVAITGCLGIMGWMPSVLAGLSTAKKPTTVLGSEGEGRLLKSGTILSLEQEIDKQAKKGTGAITKKGNELEIDCPLHDMNGVAGPNGLEIRSTSHSEGGGSLKLKLDGYGRTAGNWTTPSMNPITDTFEQVGRVSYDEVIQEFSVSSAGLRQEFIISRAPAGTGKLLLRFHLSGAIALARENQLTLTLDDSGRQLSYGNVQAIDATGKTLSSRFIVSEANAITIEVDDSGSSYPLRIGPTITDNDWVSIAGLNGTDDPIYAVAFHSNTLYIGGDFDIAGTAMANGVAQWDGSSWSSLGTGTNSTVYALAVDLAGNLYAGGHFTRAGGLPANRIAKWDGQSWTSLGAGLYNTVYALAIAPSGSLVAGGSFTSASGVPANRIAQWDGFSWSALGSGMDDNVTALVFDSTGNLYAGGDFSTADGLSVHSIAAWDGSSWSALGTGVEGSVSALAADDSGKIFAGGSFSTAGDSSASNIAQWDGSSWSSLGDGLNDAVTSLSYDQFGKLYVGGSFTSAGNSSAYGIAMWDGTTWSPLGDDDIALWGNVYALAVDSSGRLYIGGYFIGFNDSTASSFSVAYSIAQWDGSSLLSVGDELMGVRWLVSAIAFDSSGNVYAGGFSESWYSGESGINIVGKWDGSSWSPLGNRSLHGTIYDLVVDEDDNLYAAGNFTDSSSGSAQRMYIAKWDGTSWSTLGSGMSDAVFDLVLSSSGKLIASGAFTSAGGTPANRIAQWDGNSWSSLGSGMDNDVSALALDSCGNLYAGGSFSSAGGVSAKYIAQWDGEAWSALGSGLDGSVSTVVSGFCGQVYAGGTFTAAGGASADYIATWDGENWSAVGQGVNGIVYTLALDRTNQLYAGGMFTAAGDTSVNHIAKWNGANWLPLGTGISSDVYILAFDSLGTLYAGGSFVTAGNIASRCIAQCTGLYDSATVSTQPVTDISSSSATGHGTIHEHGTSLSSQHGVCWNTSGSPDLNDDYTEEGLVKATGPFNSAITGLTVGTTYYLRAYVTNEAGTEYGEEVTFTTANPASVTTQEATNICTTSVSAHGTITDLGTPPPNQHGFCWNRDGAPTKEESTCNENGTAGVSGSFSSEIGGLISGYTYYLRAYVTNDAGTIYGEEVTFTTVPTPADVSTQSIANITSDSARAHIYLTSYGSPLARIGACLNTSGTPTVDDTYADGGYAMSTGEYSFGFSGLAPNTTYYVMAYATNEAGTVYGNQLSFTTLQEQEEDSVVDSDNDGVSDQRELACGSDPADPQSYCAQGLPWLWYLLE